MTDWAAPGGTMSVFTFLVLYKASRLVLFRSCCFLGFAIFTPTSPCSAKAKCNNVIISFNVAMGRNFYFVIYCVFMMLLLGTVGDRSFIE